MKVLVVHNLYQNAGGEDAVVAAEEEALLEDGHTVIRYRRGNEELQNARYGRMISAGLETIWAPTGDLELLISRERPDVAHFHNTFPLISPAAYYACQNAGIPVVQTLHNYRLLCPGTTLFRDGRVCEACLGRSVPWPAVLHGCYRGSRPTTSAVAGMLTIHRVLQTWKKQVNIYIALSNFARIKFIEGGLPAERIVVKQNCVSRDPNPTDRVREYALYVGRLIEEKGIRILLSAWKELTSGIPLKIAGHGQLEEKVISDIAERELRWIEFLGRVAPQDIYQWMQGARFLIFPSEWFECFPMTIAEAFACGLPVIVSRMGAMEEIVEDGKTGLHFTPGDPLDLAAKVNWAWNHPGEMREMGRAARAEYESKYTAKCNYLHLMEIYCSAVSQRDEHANR